MTEKKRAKRRYPIGAGIDETGADDGAPVPDTDPPPTSSSRAPLDAEVPPDVDTDPDAPGWADGLVVDKQGRPKPTAANLILIFENHPIWSGLAYDERALRIEWKAGSELCGSKAGVQLRDSDVGAAVKWLSFQYAIQATIANTLDAMTLAAQSRPFDPLRDWIETLEWDQVGRLDRWLIEATGCEPSLYSMAVGEKFLISAIARAMIPGCKVDAMLILCGPQGTLKSTLLSKLGGPWFSDQIGEIGNKDTLLQIHGPWLIEMSELDSMSKREAGSIKAFLTTTTDRFRKPYGRIVEEYPRRCVFAGTTNQDTFLRDDTGGRRFWPIEIEKINLEYIEQNRDQLWAEAAHKFAAGERWWLPDDVKILEESEQEQERRRQVEPWEAKIAGWIDDSQTRISSLSMDEVLEGIGVEISRRDRSAAIRAGFALKRLGWRRRRKRVKGGLLAWIYEPPIRGVGPEDVTPEQAAEDQGPDQRGFGY